MTELGQEGVKTPQTGAGDRSDGLPSNVVTRHILITDLSQQIKKQRDFLKWMSRRYANENQEQSQAFSFCVGVLEELRQEILNGLFDVVPGEEVFTEELPGSLAGEIQELTDQEILDRAAQISREELDNNIRLALHERRSRAGTVGYTQDGRAKCPDAFCDYAVHEGAHSND